MPVVKKNIFGVDYWKIRVSKNPEKYMYFPASLPMKTAREYSALGRRFVRGLASPEELLATPDVYCKLQELGYIRESRLLDCKEAAAFCGISEGHFYALSLGVMVPVKMIVANGRRYFDRNDLVEWVERIKSQIATSPYSWIMNDERV